MSADLILASVSQSRRRLLQACGIDAELITPHLDEETAKESMRMNQLPIKEQAMKLAELKAIKVSARQPGMVIGGDQMLALGDKAFDKPKDLGEARGHLEQLSGKAHTLETAIVIAQGGQIIWRHLARPKLTMRTLSPEFINQYIEAVGEDILTTVGGYKLEGLGSQLFERIEGDYFSILGLPLLPLQDYLRTRGALPL